MFWRCALVPSEPEVWSSSGVLPRGVPRADSGANAEASKAPCGLPVSFSMCGRRPSRRLWGVPCADSGTTVGASKTPCGLPMSFLMCGGRPCRRLGACPVRTWGRLWKRQRPCVGYRCRSRCEAVVRVVAVGRALCGLGYDCRLAPAGEGRCLCLYVGPLRRRIREGALQSRSRRREEYQSWRPAAEGPVAQPRVCARGPEILLARGRRVSDERQSAFAQEPLMVRGQADRVQLWRRSTARVEVGPASGRATGGRAPGKESGVNNEEREPGDDLRCREPRVMAGRADRVGPVAGRRRGSRSGPCEVVPQASGRPGSRVV